MTSLHSTSGSAEKFTPAEVSAAAPEGRGAGNQEREERPAPQEAESQQGSDDSDNESSTQSESTWLFRAQYKTDELRKIFNLPESEVKQQPASLPNLALHVYLGRAWVTFVRFSAPPHSRYKEQA